MPAPTSSTTPTARGGSKTRSPTTWIAGAAAGNPARSTRNTSATSSTSCRRRPTGPRAARSQLAGDFYAACMDESRVDALGSKPLRALARRRRRDQGQGRRAAHDRQAARRGRLRAFVVFAGEDLHEPSKTIAHVFAGGLGMPDRDYYLKTEAALRRGAREVPRARGEDVRARRSRRRNRRSRTPTRVFAFEKRLAEASLDNVQAARPEAAGPPDRVCRPGQDRAEFRLGRILRRRAACRAMRST